MKEAARLLCLSGGGILICLSFLLYPDDRKQVQNRLAEVWLKLAVAGEGARSTAVSVFQSIGRRIQSALGRLIGEQWISGALVWHCFFVSLSAVQILSAQAAAALPVLLFLLALAVSTLPLLATIPKPLRWLSACIGVLVVVPISIAVAQLSHGAFGTVAAVAGCVPYAVSLLLVRRTLAVLLGGWPSRRQRTEAGILVCAYAVCVLILAYHFENMLYLFHYTGSGTLLLIELWYAFGLFAGLSVAGLWPIVLWVASFSLLTFHHAVWEVSERMVYNLWEVGILDIIGNSVYLGTQK